MPQRKQLFLYEEITLLALRNEKGTVATGFAETVIAGAIMAELLLNERISVEQTKKQLVNVENSNLTGDTLLDECLERISTSKRRASISTWVSRLAHLKKLRHRVALQLCDRGILHADEDKVLLFFTRKIYPEINPVPEKRIIDRLSEAIFTEATSVDPRTVVLISLAHGAGLLSVNFDRKEIRSRKKRIEQIVKGELTGKATKSVIDACQAAIMIATMTPIIVSTFT